MGVRLATRGGGKSQMLVLFALPQSLSSTAYSLRSICYLKLNEIVVDDISFFPLFHSFCARSSLTHNFIHNKIK